MPLDAIFVTELCEELKNRITGMKIDRVRQPEKDTVVFTLRGQGVTERLLVCFGSSARICLTKQEYENPPQPPMFCMLLRKHLIGARILDVSQPEQERMMLLKLLTYNEFGEASEKTMAVELLGRNANLILVDEEGRILDAARRVDAEMSPARQVLPGLIYRLPPKPEPGRFSGLSPLIAREMEFRGLEKSPEAVAKLEKKPHMLLLNGEPKDFSFLPIWQYGPGSENVPYDSCCELLEAFWAEKDRQSHLKSRGKSLAKLVRSAKNRTEKKLALRMQELKDCEDREKFKRRGDLITANIWRMKKGMDSLVCEDFYAEDCPAVSIPLDPMKTPQQNAAACYKTYTKKKAAEEHLTRLIEENSTELEYLGSVADELERAQSRQDLDDIRAELEEGGYVRASGDKRKKKPKPAQPMRYETKSGLEILVGRNNVQNDELTFKIARRTDWWFHAQKIHGAHVILCCEGREPDEEAVMQAASLAAFHSEAAQAGRVPVDMTQVRFVKKPRGARAGMVIYTDQKTVLAEPKETEK
ncbi:MAG: fibronectin/fibrinogen-binding protein [Ruminococcaceae bacterium]|nr:fibronectin/fibrinogen-binding protein [Oscillospiraceae bacterium]